MAQRGSDNKRTWPQRVSCAVGALASAGIAALAAGALLVAAGGLIDALPEWVVAAALLLAALAGGYAAYTWLCRRTHYLLLSGSAVALAGLALATLAWLFVRGDYMGSVSEELAGAPDQVPTFPEPVEEPVIVDEPAIIEDPVIVEDPVADEPVETEPAPEMPAAPPMPAFPWPPPRASAMQVLPTVFLRDPVTLADVSRALTATLELAGKHELRFYAAPNGFAMVTRLESVDRNGDSLGDADRGAVTDFLTYIRDLFWVPPGNYRMVVFIATDRSFEASGEALDRPAAEALITGGFNDLPDALARQPYSTRHRTTALVYEFHKARERDIAQVQLPGRFTAHQHLHKIGWYAATAALPRLADTVVIFPESTASGPHPR
ncbi:MAG: hypothetical protein QNJ91_17700 [Gammaproteobacteria bacterium]|nr:hypothetical protein [Gammaproteobacteria bacterium]